MGDCDDAVELIRLVAQLPPDSRIAKLAADNPLTTSTEYLLASIVDELRLFRAEIANAFRSQESQPVETPKLLVYRTEEPDKPQEIDDGKSFISTLSAMADES